MLEEPRRRSGHWLSRAIALALLAGLRPAAASGPAARQPGSAFETLAPATGPGLDGRECAAGPEGEWEPGVLAVNEGILLYERNCSTCHGRDGLGLPSASPPLAGHAPRLLSARDGRAYLMRVPLFGLAGEIQVGGRPYTGVMAPFIFRTDAELAAILNHVLTAWGNRRLLPKDHQSVTAEEVARERALFLSPEAVRAGRPPLAPAP